MSKSSRDDGAGRHESGLTIIAHGTRVVGEVEGTGVVKIEGTVVGAVKAERQVLVAKGGVIEGDVFSREAVLGGVVRGSVQAAERVEVQEGASVQGDITTKRLVVAEGGDVNGTVSMTDQAEAAAVV